jgi:hypothetical protein
VAVAVIAVICSVALSFACSGTDDIEVALSKFVASHHGSGKHHNRVFRGRKFAHI